MRRALILIIVLSAGSFGLGGWIDHLQQKTAMAYHQALEQVRAALKQGAMQKAREEERYWQAMWQHDARWLNALMDHHHTRDISAAMARLGVALEMEWMKEAILALNEAQDALEEVAGSEQAVWENIL